MSEVKIELVTKKPAIFATGSAAKEIWTLAICVLYTNYLSNEIQKYSIYDSSVCQRGIE